jgi:hypothetical protein
MMKINHTQAKALAAFIHTVRGDWGIEGTVTALGQARDQADLETLARWAIRAALDANNRTPAVIAMPGAHREPAQTGAPRREWPDDAHRCRTCSLDRPAHDRLNANTPEPAQHPWETAVGDRRLPADQARAVVGELRDHKSADPPPRPKPETSTHGTERVAQIRAEMDNAKEGA